MCHFLPLCWVCYLTRSIRIVKGRLQNIIGKHSPIPWYIYIDILVVHMKEMEEIFYHCGSPEKTISSLLCGNTKKKQKSGNNFHHCGLVGLLIVGFICM
jgi:hypothetical protein